MKLWRKGFQPRSDRKDREADSNSLPADLADLANRATQSAAPEHKLRNAVASSELEMVNELLDGGADIEDPDENGTVLTFAAMNGKAKIVKLLVERGANVNATDQDGNTALHHVAWEGWKEIAHLLIESGADVNARNAEGLTPRMIAQSAGNSIIAAVLKDAGAE